MCLLVFASSSVLKQPKAVIPGLLPVPVLQAPTCEGLRWKRKGCSKEIVVLGSETSLVASLIVVCPRVKFCHVWSGQGLSHLGLPQMSQGPAVWPWQGSLQPHCSSHFRVKAWHPLGCGGGVNALWINPSLQQGTQQKNQLSSCPTNEGPRSTLGSW